MTSTSIYQPIAPTYLYIKQHSVTKKKYFGKTTKTDPYEYNGSGPYWLKHIKKHGKEHIVTLWVSELYYDTSIVEVALQFSADNDIVNSDEWANLEPENGLNGWVPGRKRSEETKDKQSAAKKGKNAGPRLQETKDKISASMQGKNTGPRSPQSEEHKAKLSAANKGKSTSEETKAKISAAKKGKNTGPIPKFFSIIETRKTYAKANLSRYYPEFKIYY